MNRLLVSFGLLFLLSACAEKPEIQNIFVDFDKIEKVKKSINKGEETYLDAYTVLIEKAETAMLETPVSVMDKKRTPPSGDKHDYLSGGPYWWPDSSKNDGLPYIRRDGEVNPEMRGENVDPPAKNKMMENVETLGWAYFFSGEIKYAGKAIEQLEVWFINPETKMNPNLNFAQGIPGRVEGRGIGIIDWAGIHRLVTSIQIFDANQLLTGETKTALYQWFEDYYTWLHTHEYGIFEDNYFNNHGTWFDVQAVSIALLLGKTDEAITRLENKTKARIASQIESDGSMPHELARTKSLSYTAMNLRGFCHLANMANSLNIDLWNYKTADGRGILTSLDYMLPFVRGEEVWEYEQISDTDDAIESAKYNFLMAASQTKNKEFLNIAKSIKEPNDKLEFLLYPIEH